MYVMRKRHHGHRLHFIASLGLEFVRTPIKTPWDLDLYLVLDHRHMKAIDVDYSVRVGYWASKNNVQEHKVYVTMIQIFDSDFVNNLWQALGNNLWPAESINCNYKTRLLRWI
jgi:hypothetical protein